MAKNRGVYEPEYRLLVLVFYLITIIPSTFGLGMAIESGQSAIVCAVFHGIMNFAVGVGCTGIVSYSNDTLQHRAGENFGLTVLVKSAYAFGLSFVFNEFYATHGPRIFWFTWEALAVGVTLLSVPLYVFGKRIQSWSTRNNIL